MGRNAEKSAEEIAERDEEIARLEGADSDLNAKLEELQKQYEESGTAKEAADAELSKARADLIREKIRTNALEKILERISIFDPAKAIDV